VYLAQMLKPLSDLSAAPGVARGETIVDMSDLPIAEFAPEIDDVELGSVVLKEFVLPAQAGKNIRKRVLQNIQREAMLWRKLRHPNIARMLDFFVEDQRAYLVLEHIEGTTLKELVTASGIITERRVVELSIQLCDILGYMHRRQPPILHRDFTPDNLMIDKEGTVKLIDFNVAQQLEAQTTKTVVGKHAYIPPEQFRGKADTRSDIYACGATLFFLLTGVEPEPISEAHPQAIAPHLSAEIDRIVAKATSPGLSTRYQSCQELKTDLLALLPSEVAQPLEERGDQP
jgi:serine/threonine protein kinase